MIEARRRIAASFADARKREREGDDYCSNGNAKPYGIDSLSPPVNGLPLFAEQAIRGKNTMGERISVWQDGNTLRKYGSSSRRTVASKGTNRSSNRHREYGNTIRVYCKNETERNHMSLSLSLFSKINKRIIHRFLAFEIFLSKNMIIRLLL